MPNQNDEWSQYEVKPSAKTANAPAPKKDEWSQYEVAPQETAPAPKAQPKEDWRDPYTKVHPHQRPTQADTVNSAAAAKYLGREGVKGIKNIGAGVLGVILHPVDTAVGIGKLGYHAGEAAFQGNYQDIWQDVYQMGKQFYDQPLEAAETMVGQTAVFDAAGRVIPKVAKGVKGLAPRAARTLTGTGPDVAVDLAKKTEKANALKEGKTAALNARRAEVDAGRIDKAKAANDESLKAHDEDAAAADKKRRDAHDKYLAEKTEVENINQAAAAIPDARAGLENHAKDLTEQADVRIEKARHDALEEGNSKHNTVNEQLNPLPSNRGFLQSATLDAFKEIKGSNTSVPILKDMKRYLKSGKIPTYKKLQGYYSELGQEIVKGTLPGDVYHALDTLHESIGNEMQRIADSQGLGTELKSAREYWWRMKQTFGKTSDAISDRAGKELKDKNPYYVDGQISEYRQRLLGSFDPQIPILLETAAKALERLGKLPTEESARKMIAKVPRPPEATVVPPSGTKPVPAPRAPLLAEKKTISAEDLTQANMESLAEIEKRARTGHSPLLTSISVFDAIRNGMEGNWAGVGRDVAARGLYEVGKQGFAAVLRIPSVIKFLSKPTAEQIAKIPPGLRGSNLKALLDEAKGKGIKVDPRLYVVAAASASQLAPRKNATDEWAGQ